MSISQQLEKILYQPVRALARLSGGCVADVFRGKLADGKQIVVKSGPAGDLALEGRMLRYLKQHTTLPIPAVYHSDRELLIIDYLPSSGGLNTQSQEHAADLVATLHNITAPQFGFDFDTVIGGLHQPNPPSPNWVAFFSQHRLLHMAHEAYKIKKLPLTAVTKIEKFAATLPNRLMEPCSPSLIHGDLWGGNILCSNNKISGVIDPAIYYANAEIELAFTTLFSTFDQTFFRRYQEHRPIAPGFFEERLDIYNLYPLLVHVRLFGGHYVSQVERTLQRFGF